MKTYLRSHSGREGEDGDMMLHLSSFHLRSGNTVCDFILMGKGETNEREKRVFKCRCVYLNSCEILRTSQATGRFTHR